MNHKKTACRDCKNLFIVDVNYNETKWDNFLCMAYPLPTIFNYFTGEESVQKVQYRQCQAINFGHCPNYENKGE